MTRRQPATREGMLAAIEAEHDRVAEAVAAVVVHDISIEGPISYPGGKDGGYIGHCSCGYSSGPAAYPGHAEARANAHKAAKEANQCG